MRIDKLNLEIVQGDDFTDEIIPTEDYFVSKAISAATKAGICSITATAHGLVNGLEFWIESVLGMTELNPEMRSVFVPGVGFVEALYPNGDDRYFASNVAANTVEPVGIAPVNSSEFNDYVSGGVIRYRPALDLSGYTARMSIKADLDDAAALLELSSANGELTINTSTKRVAFALTAEDTAALDFTSGYYDLELVSGAGVVTKLIRGKVKVIKEATA